MERFSASFGTGGREERGGRQNVEEKGDRGQKECHKDVIRSNERKSKMPVSVKGEWKKGLRRPNPRA